jgi:hypothetical protein
MLPFFKIISPRTLREGEVMQDNRLKRLNDNDTVRVGKVWVKASQMPEALARFTRLVFCLTDLEDHPYSLRGSSASIRWNGHHLSFLCGHQIEGFAADKIVVPLDREGKRLVSGTTLMRMMPSDGYDGEEFGDVRAMHFRPIDHPGINLDRSFFDFLEADMWHGDRESTFVVFGYPTSLRELEHAEPNYALSHIKVKLTVNAARYLQPSHALGVHAIELQRTTDHSTDGLSGGPVYILGEDAQGVFLGFAGMILRGSDTSSIVHFLEAQILLQFLRRIAADTHAI